jgi:hypothetical protein
LYFWLSSGATNNAIAGGIGVQSFTLLLWGVQLEIGGVATPLEKPDPRYDLSNCQRFYQSQLLIINQNTNSAGTNLTTSAPLMVHMRAVPTLSIVTNSCINLQNITMNPAADNWWIGAQVVASGTYTLSILATASADL